MNSNLAQYTIVGINKWFNHNGLSYKIPKGISHKFNVEKYLDFNEIYHDHRVRRTKNTTTYSLMLTIQNKRQKSPMDKLCFPNI
ncbi:winged helix-turn-helix domain-containing protein [Candidatus Enterovibrio escicola]|uniref:winged helix-turn-helix domain-containing protein n=1 Tax=Candidatus Enterovibrio escicola TaxID=1927127 RepID=UPI001237B7AC|nr:winged helix-turn-helix domain-containing protein [Candidatus Enterovibrio escacola]